TSTPQLYSLSLHDALPIYFNLAGLTPGSPKIQQYRLTVIIRELQRLTVERGQLKIRGGLALQLCGGRRFSMPGLLYTKDQHDGRSEEHTSELQSRFDLVCR